MEGSLDEPGRYTASPTLPRAGERRWQIHLEARYPTEMLAAMPQLPVEPAAGAGAASFSALASPGLM